MAKVEDRPVDAGLTSVKGKSDAEVLEWWKQRFALLAAIPTDVARAGALLPQMRELSQLPEPERRRLTRERMKAFMSLGSEQHQRILAARKLTYAADEALVKSDDAIADSLAREMPEAQEFGKRLGR